MDLWVELREIIYQNAFAIGCIQILRVNHQIYDEAKRLLYAYAFFHMDHRMFNAKRKASLLPRAVVTRIQNIHIDLDFDKLTGKVRYCNKPVKFRKHLQPFIDPQEKGRKTCLVSVKHVSLATTIDHLRTLLFVCRELTGFQNLFVTVSAGDSPNCPSAIPDRMQQANAAILKARDRRIYDLAKRILVPALGAAVWNDSKEQAKRHLEFHPQEHQQTTWLADRAAWRKEWEVVLVELQAYFDKLGL